MRAINIKWDVTDGAEKMTEEEIADTLASPPTEVELPEKFNKENYTDEDGYHEDELLEDASDWVSDEYGFCNYGIQVEE